MNNPRSNVIVVFQSGSRIPNGVVFFPQRLLDISIYIQPFVACSVLDIHPFIACSIFQAYAGQATA